ncbi:hypothetical protein DLAC_09976 [Tieghemostelium lacteum]|uniref:FNIP repeat-containing protein n=1 Tax=Tieghemostelium lacteum TaxID=361077 RepID=A0A151Z5V3_TIELA|nr:hypothetical protein DLAC_09976 [Tieghemostelium lacteum]|eukprot:KYQ89317.1 hypothetical protein DLAC_09976 [Tieghemostelium lacteum]
MKEIEIFKSDKILISILDHLDECNAWKTNFLSTCRDLFVRRDLVRLRVPITFRAFLSLKYYGSMITGLEINDNLELMVFNQKIQKKSLKCLNILEILIIKTPQIFRLKCDLKQLPLSLKSVNLYYRSGLSLVPGFIHRNITKLTLCDWSKQGIEVGSIPNTVTHLHLGCRSMAPLVKGLIPQSVTHLILGYAHNTSLGLETLPRKLQVLCFGPNFNKPLQRGEIPPKVTSVTFGYTLGVSNSDGFNKPLKEGDLPHGLLYLDLGLQYDTPLDVGSIPNTVTHLKLGDVFNKDIGEGHIPNSVIHLSLGISFNRYLWPGQIPSSVQTLIMSKMFNMELGVGTLPSSLTDLRFGTNYNHPLVPKELPQGLKKLEFGYYFDQELHRGVLPDSLTHLIIQEKFSKTLSANRLPSKLKSLTLLTDNIKIQKSVTYPISIDEISYNEFSFNYHMPPAKRFYCDALNSTNLRYFPSTVTHLSCRRLSINQPIGDIVHQPNTKNITYMKCSELDIRSVSDGYVIFPRTLKYLEVEKKITGTISANHFSGKVDVIIPQAYMHCIDPNSKFFVNMVPKIPSTEFFSFRRTNDWYHQNELWKYEFLKVPDFAFYSSTLKTEYYNE